MIIKILETPHPKLLKKAKEIKKIDQEIINLALDMQQTLRANFGLGLAAPQVGKLLRLIVVENPKNESAPGVPEIPLTILINPKITKFSQEIEVFEESCLSLPGLAGEVPRAKEVEVKGLDLKGKQIRINASGLYARVLQHEIDHLDGILFPNRVEDIQTLKKVPTPYKFIFLGTSEFAIPIMEGLIKNKWGVSLIITEPDKPVGRKKILTPPPIKNVGQRYGLIIHQPQKIKDEIQQIKNLKPDLIILAAYGQIIPKEILDIPKYGSLCLHPSLLPKYRGPSPIQAAILNGDKETGVTIIKMDEKIDHGPILAQQELEILNPKSQILNNYQITNSQITTEVLSKILSKTGAKLLLETLPLYLEGKIKPKPQNHKKATYTRLLKKEDGRIDWTREAAVIEREIRAFRSWPGSFTFWNTKMLKILAARVSKVKPEPPAACGVVFLNKETKEPAILCGKDSLIINQLQMEGKNKTSGKAFLNGHPQIIGAILSHNN